MAKIEVTKEQERVLQSKGYVVKPVTDVVYNRRSFWDPHKDESGQVMGWTRPLPADGLRMNRYLAKGFLLQDPDGNFAPPPGHFRRDKGIASPGVKAVTTGGQDVGEKGEEITKTLQCPICQKDFPDNDSLIHHMIYHRSKVKKVKAKKSKRGKSRKSKKSGANSPEEV